MFERNKSYFRQSVWNFDLNLWILRACRHQNHGRLVFRINDLEASVKISWKYQQVHELWIIKALLARKTHMVSRVTSVIAKIHKNILRVIFRWRDMVSQLRVTVRLVVVLVCCFLLCLVVKPLPIKRQTGTFKPSITPSNLVFSIALVCRSV